MMPEKPNTNDVETVLNKDSLFSEFERKGPQSDEARRLIGGGEDA